MWTGDFGYAPDGNLYRDSYPVTLFRRDLPSGGLKVIPPAKELQAEAGPCRPATVFAADPVNVATGQFTLPETDVSIPGRGPGTSFVRTYNSGLPLDGPLGYGWSHNYETNLVEYTTGEVFIVDCLGRRDLYTPNGGGYNPPPGKFATLVHNGDSTWTLTERNQVKRTFSSAGKLTAIADRNNNSVTLAYNGSNQLTTVTDAGGRTLTFTYTGARITSIAVPLDRTISFTYNGSGDLTSVVDMRGKTWSYTYDTSHRLLTKVDPLSHTVLTNVYGTQDRVVSQKDAKNGETKFEYAANGGSTKQIDPRGKATTHTFNT